MIRLSSPSSLRREKCQLKTWAPAKSCTSTSFWDRIGDGTPRSLERDPERPGRTLSTPSGALPKCIFLHPPKNRIHWIIQLPTHSPTQTLPPAPGRSAPPPPVAAAAPGPRRGASARPRAAPAGARGASAAVRGGEGIMGSWAEGLSMRGRPSAGRVSGCQIGVGVVEEVQ